MAASKDPLKKMGAQKTRRRWASSLTVLPRKQPAPITTPTTQTTHHTTRNKNNTQNTQCRQQPDSRPRERPTSSRRVASVSQTTYRVAGRKCLFLEWARRPPPADRSDDRSTRASALSATQAHNWCLTDTGAGNGTPPSRWPQESTAKRRHALCAHFHATSLPTWVNPSCTGAWL